MERIQVLINKLVDQQEKGENVGKLLMTVQLLHQELLAENGGNMNYATGKVAVTMPFMFVTTPAPIDGEPEDDEPAPALREIPENDKRFVPADSITASAASKPTPKPAVQTSLYELRKPLIEEAPTAVTGEKEVFQLHDTQVDEVPTLMQHVGAERDVHEMIAEKKESLNDLLRSNDAEVVQRLSEAPIKDLRKGIALNDKFVFINELFRGEEDVYERSIKTINAFRILPEAEYWMNRELKVKMGWNDNSPVVQHFYAIVRRRFS